jgi:hypothetical protein
MYVSQKFAFSAPSVLSDSIAGFLLAGSPYGKKLKGGLRDKLAVSHSVSVDPFHFTAQDNVVL